MREDRPLTPKEILILYLYRQLSPRQKRIVRDYYIRGDKSELTVLLEKGRK